MELYPTYWGHNSPNQELLHLELLAKFFLRRNNNLLYNLVLLHENCSANWTMAK